MAYRHISVYNGDEKIRTYGGCGSDVRRERDKYRDMEFRKEKHPQLTEQELEELIVVYK